MRVSLSFEAYDSLVQQARNLYYVSRKLTHHARGFSLYVAAIADYGTFADARPQYVRDTDLSLLQAGRLPIWTPDIRRTRYDLTLTPQQALQLTTKALQLGISNYHITASVTSAPSVMSAALEAIGVGWLQVTNVPIYQLGLGVASQRKPALRMKHRLSTLLSERASY